MIRLATIADAPAIAALIRRYDPPAPRAETFARELVSSGVVLTTWRRDQLAGLLALKLDRWGWNGAPFMRDDGFLCIDAGAGARQLIRAAKAIARRKGLPLYLGQSTGDRVAALARLYRQEGGAIVGTVALWHPARC